MAQKVILIIGGTGAQGIPTIKELLKPAVDGSSPYAIRVLTRDPDNYRAQMLRDLGCELVQGSVKDLGSVAVALQGVYGAFVNIDGFTIGEKEEIYAGLRIYELAKQQGVKHYVWSSLDYFSKKGNFDPKYRCGHYDAKGRIADFLKAQPSAKSPSDGMVWSVITSGPYTEMLSGALFIPRLQEDGAFLWSHPLGEGAVPLIALSDFGYFARWIFDHPEENSGVDLEVASHMTTWKELVETFERVTGKRGRYEDVDFDSYFGRMGGGNQPVAKEAPEGLTFRQNFTGAFNGWKDNIATRDMEKLRKIHPGLRTLEAWMKETQYDGTPTGLLLKGMETQGAHLPRGR
ncbi:SubName: Full=Uncharacterized protein {ECO:0000313/EMBL:CCA70429.1} [Serendipita indica DSM 11827]|uniref:NmrA-like domain-containing protein n=1 Tax=Serendipita indica (strain DSM 11827) TaxID=1109443 RepID=G4TGI8_SERID|nr:SubName: Full=Uncharacterized protein {ECO:0000313/EMBL:CCA70429.1} [Serendipita indica DSM 11827]CCA70429.1 hypothetical protein PIIN_04368 [Serendipita indica DSM 11827]